MDVDGTSQPVNNMIDFYNLFEIADGLQNHTGITGIQHATSFNLFRALFKTNMAHLFGKQPALYYDSSKIQITENLNLPIMALYNSYNYFPQMQVVWTTNKIFIDIPGKPVPTSKSLLTTNKLLSRFLDKYESVKTDSVHPNQMTPRIPRPMLKKYEETKDKIKTSWVEKYKKYCKSSEPECQYTNIDKLINQMKKVKLNLTSLT
jgi:hypothetical protein